MDITRLPKSQAYQYLLNISGGEVTLGDGSSFDPTKATNAGLATKSGNAVAFGDKSFDRATFNGARIDTYNSSRYTRVTQVGSNEVLLFDAIGSFNHNLGLGSGASSNNIETIVYGENIKFVETYQHTENPSLKSVVMNKGMTGLAEGAFFGCTKLSTVELSSTLKEIGIMALAECAITGAFNVPDSMENIGDISCYSNQFTEVNLFQTMSGSKLKTIGEYAFYTCFLIEKPVVFPSGLTTVAQGAFSFCSNIRSIYVDCPYSVFHWSTFDGCNNLSTIYLGENATGWPSTVFSIGAKTKPWINYPEL